MFAVPYHNYKQSMTTTVLPIARPWTPPDMDSEDDIAAVHSALADADTDAHSGAIADSGYFGDAHTPSREQRVGTWSRSTSSASDRSHSHSHAHAHGQQARPVSKIPHRRNVNNGARKPRYSNSASGRPAPIAQHAHQAQAQQQRPYTPTKQLTPSLSLHPYDNAQPPSYPATPPDSARLSSRSTSASSTQFLDIDDSPLPYRMSTPSPVDLTRTSPVQNALFSCLNNLERLIGTSQPDDEQMEHIISQFEGLTSYLSAPEVETRDGDEHLFSEPEDLHVFSSLEVDAATKTGMDEAKAPSQVTLTKEEAEAYIAEVGHFIEGVKAHSADLKTRLDEVHALNELNTDIIAKLRKQLKASKDTVEELSEELSASRITVEELRDELHESKELIGDLREQLRPRNQKVEDTNTTEEEEGEDDDEKGDDEDGEVDTAPTGFWSSFTGALDFVSEMMYEW